MNKRFSLIDATLYVHMEGCSPRPIWHRCLNALKAAGYQVGPDMRIRTQYPTLDRNHRSGLHSQLQFESEIWDYPKGRHGFKLEFYQDVVKKHPVSGKYDFNRVATMPFLIRMRFNHAIREIRAFLLKEGFIDQSEDPSKLSATDKVRMRILSSGHCRVDPLTEWQPDSSRNGTSADGDRLYPGEVRYFYHNGHLTRGTIYYGLNNMWYAVTGSRTYVCVSAHQLFHWKPGLTRRPAVDPVKKVQASMERAVKAHNFERAIVCRDWLLTHKP